MATNRTKSPMDVWSRRSFLRGAALTGGSLVLPGGLLLSCSKRKADTKHWTEKQDRPHYFVFYYMIGGWDLVMTTEPFEQGAAGVLVPYPKDQILEVGSHRFGPAMKPVADYMDKMAIIRGLYVRALNHPQARFRMVTGKFRQPHEKPAASIQTIMAEKFLDRYEIPSLTTNAMRPQVFRGEADLKLAPLRVKSIEELRNLTSVNGATTDYQDEIKAAIQRRDQILRKQYPGHELVQNFGDFSEIAMRANEGSYPKRLDLAAAHMDEVTKRSHRTHDQARLAVEAIREDLAPCVTVGTGEFDSHTEYLYKQHPMAVTRGMKTVGLIAKGLEESVLADGTNLLDHTTIVVSSEFSRDPAKNELGGKHHWNTNSMLIIGKGVKRSPNKGEPVVWGRVDENLSALPINPSNGSETTGTVDLEVTYALATLLAMRGIDPVPHLGVEPIPDLLG